MRSTCLVSVVGLVSRIPPTIKKCDCLNFCTVIVRALASMLEYVGMIKSEHMLTDIEFESKFYELLRRYSVLYQKSRIVTPVRKSMNVAIGNLTFTDTYAALDRPH